MQSKSILFKYILALLLFGLMFSSVPRRAEAQYNYATLHAFDKSDGNAPQGGIAFDGSGNLYGTAIYGGTYDYGVVWEIDVNGVFSVLHSFNPRSHTDGSLPQGGVVVDNSGNLYGTTPYGGAYGDGVVWKIDGTGVFSLLHSFNHQSNTDGSSPVGNVTLDNNGNIYGTTYGGAGGYGSVFKIDKSGNFSLLHSFNDNITDGAYPFAAVTLDDQGNLYGTTTIGGQSSNPDNAGQGTVFEIDTHGNYSTLHSFTGQDGANPLAPVTLDSSGVLYGTTHDGGANNVGTVWKLDRMHKFSVLHNFSLSPTDGRYPEFGVTVDSNDNLYGTTRYGGPTYFGVTGAVGVLWKIDNQGNFSILKSFDWFGSLGGGQPLGGVTLDSNGSIYGTLTDGGPLGDGTVFELANNITAPTIQYIYHGFVHRPGSHTLTQQVTITNTSGAALAGPFNLVISTLPVGVTLNNATGTTAFNHPGSPYLAVGGSSLAAGASITVTLSFNDPHLSYVAYSPTFLAGNGTP